MSTAEAYTTRSVPADPDALRLARLLGWFSIALGLAEVAAPRAIARSLNMRGQESLVAACGAREIVTGIGILASAQPARWMWGRVAGDAVDLAALAASHDHAKRNKTNVAMALAAVAGVTALDIVCARWLSASQVECVPLPDYSRRSGLPRPPDEMRGAAGDFAAPEDMRIPAPLQPYTLT